MNDHKPKSIEYSHCFNMLPTTLQGIADSAGSQEERQEVASL